MSSRSVLVVSALTVCSALLGLTAHAATAAPHGVTVFLERNGQVVANGDEDVEIPRFGGGETAWSSIVTCVKQQFSPFQIDIVERRPSRGDFITAVIGGRASQLGLDDRSTNGVGPYDGSIIPNAVVHIFSKVGTGERDAANLCAVTVHEVSHALGLDHSHKCGDVMSYFLDRCGPRRILDVDAPCGEDRARECSNGDETQNSYRRIAAAVGLRKPDARPEPPEPDTAEPDDVDPWAQAGDAGGVDDQADATFEPDEEPAAPPQRATRWQRQPSACDDRRAGHWERRASGGRRVIVIIRRR